MEFTGHFSSPILKRVQFLERIDEKSIQIDV